MEVPVEISARHIHLTEEDYHTLFGNAEPKVIKELSQKGQFASDKLVKVTSLGDQEISARFLGPFRKFSQLELTKTDAYLLKIKTNVEECLCGLTDALAYEDGAQVTIIGDKGKLTKKIAMTARRHLHINTAKAQELGLKESQEVGLKIGTIRSTLFEKVLVRIDDSYSFDVHIDVDEANAAGIEPGSSGELIF